MHIARRRDRRLHFTFAGDARIRVRTKMADYDNLLTSLASRFGPAHGRPDHRSTSSKRENISVRAENHARLSTRCAFLCATSFI